MPITLIFNHLQGDTGLGDTIRGMYAYFILSKKIGFSMYYDFTDQNLGHCFTTNIEHICDKNCKIFRDMSATGSEKTHEFVNFITTIAKYPEKQVFHIRTNHCFDVVSFEDLTNKEYREAFLKWLKISPKLESRIKNLSPTSSYISIHIRCGDHHMQNGPCTNDSRCDPNDKKLDQLIENLAKKGNIVFTDNLELRNKFKKYCLNTKTAIHIGQKATSEEVIDTVAEFFILGKGSKIIASVRSGFSYWPSIFFGKNYEIDSINKTISSSVVPTYLNAKP